MAAHTFHLEQGAEPYPGFHLIHILGRGGWGEVWKARRADGEFFALKFLPCDNPLIATQEIRALQTIRQLQHPNLIRIDNVWSCQGFLVIVMELAEGNLLDLLSVYETEMQTGIYPEHACFFLHQAAVAIDYLNSRQHKVKGQRVAFRHCDIKPSNLLVLGDTVKVADFSLAVQTSSSMGYHRKSGTPPYVAPEVQQGWLSDRSDQYSLAVTYCLLRTRGFPFEAVQTTLNLSKLSPPERPILARALAPVPQDRWPTCVELMNRLQQGCAKTPVAC